MLSDSVRLPAARFSVTGSTGRRRSLSRWPTSLARRDSLVEAGSVPSLAPAAILAIHRGPGPEGLRAELLPRRREASDRVSDRSKKKPRRSGAF
jgi:hypothetical protein